ncbi:hypothetical protein [Algoriphagus antarcticus]|uniref:Uncharacterized protein n=1 Tax=Algoriphagus antarcticus TaxID=238540 RepID=A0A3E0D5Y4_9BACT|nr:hypothetical protein [Algoriphagus antarcticus]REG77515.1 hypothetical protein C8N25_14315 [Algoriphagus antarcticus]
MNKLAGKLPIIAFVFAAFAAFAFTSPPIPEYGLSGSNWIDVTGLTPGPTTYQCNLDPQACTREAPNTSAPVVKTGIFKNNMP